jgi:predicted phosphodiesterase
MKRIAVIGDPHGCIDEFEELIRVCEKEQVDDIWVAGDLGDRGPDSGAVVERCRTLGVRAIAGNHDLVLRDAHKRGKIPSNPDKARTFRSIRSDADWEWLHSLPPIHVIDDLNLVIVHGGVLPGMALWKQPEKLLCRLQLVHPDRPDHTYWFTEGRDGTPEADYRARGYRRWYEVYDHVQDVVFGHSVFREPLQFQTPSGAWAFGVDQGAVFGGKLTALIYPDKFFVSIQAKREYAGRVRGHDSSYGVSL